MGSVRVSTVVAVVASFTFFLLSFVTISDCFLRLVVDRYKSQKHDLFVTKNEKVDYFLADSSNSGFKMITGGPNSGPS
jgi:hypothetical protein